MDSGEVSTIYECLPSHPPSPNYRTMTPRTFPDLVDIEQELFELPHKVRPEFQISLFSLSGTQI